MIPASDERERPHEWLRRLAEDRRAWAVFLASGDVLGCAYRIAVAARRVSDRSNPIPTLREVDAALCLLQVRGVSDRRLCRGRLGDACDERGLLVIQPETRRAA